MTEYQPGDIVSGHVWTGTEWLPVHQVQPEPPVVGTRTIIPGSASAPRQNRLPWMIAGALVLLVAVVAVLAILRITDVPRNDQVAAPGAVTSPTSAAQSTPIKLEGTFTYLLVIGPEYPEIPLDPNPPMSGRCPELLAKYAITVKDAAGVIVATPTMGTPGLVQDSTREIRCIAPYSAEVPESTVYTVGFRDPATGQDISTIATREDVMSRRPIPLGVSVDFPPPEYVADVVE